MAYELVRYQKLRTDLINKTELPSQLVYTRETRVTPYAYGGVRHYGYGDDIDNAIDAAGLKNLRTGAPGMAGQLQQAAYTAGKNEALGALAKFEQSAIGQKIAAVTQTAAEGVAAAKSIKTQLDDYIAAVKDGKVTASTQGVFQTAAIGEAMLSVGISFANKLGANSKVTSQVMAVAGTITACAGAVMAGAAVGTTATPIGTVVGAAVGALGCALSAIMTSLGFLEGTSEYRLKGDQPRALFRPAQAQIGVIQHDAAQLAAVLHAWYGQVNLDGVMQRMARWEYFRSTIYPQAPPYTSTGAYSGNERDTQPVPGFDTWAMLQALAFEHGADHHEAGEQVRMVLYDLAVLRQENELAKQPNDLQPALAKDLDKVPNGIFDLRRHYIDWNDINVAAIRQGAAMGRGLLAATGSSVITRDYRGRSDTVPDFFGFTQFEDFDRFVGDYQGRIRTLDFMPFIRLAELLHIFAAMTSIEVDRGHFNDGRGDTAFVLTNVLPVRFYACSAGQDSSCSTYAAAAPFNGSSWTTLQRGAGRAVPFGGPGESTLIADIRNKDYDALLEFAFIRLSAAFSHLYLTKSWLGPKGDSIAVIAARSDGNPLGKPVDPCTVVDGKLDARENLAIVTDTKDARRLAGSRHRVRGIYSPRFDVWDQVRDWKFLAEMVRRIEASLGPAYNNGRMDALGILDANWPSDELPGEDTSYVMARPDASVAFRTASQKNMIDPAMKAAMMRGEFANVGDMSGQYAQQCVREGGVVTWNAAGEIQCNPSAAAKPAMEAKCRASGGVPTWMQGRKGQQMRCLPPMHPDAPKQLAVAGSSNSIVPIVGIAAVALLAFRFLK